MVPFNGFLLIGNQGFKAINISFTAVFGITIGLVVDLRQYIAGLDISPRFCKDIDDSLAVVMALNSPELDIIAISGVYGNTKLKDVSKEIKQKRTLSNLDKE